MQINFPLLINNCGFAINWWNIRRFVVLIAEFIRGRLNSMWSREVFLNRRVLISVRGGIEGS